MTHSGVVSAPFRAPWVVMSGARTSSLAPLASLLFAVGGVAGWTGTVALRTCAAGPQPWQADGWGSHVAHASGAEGSPGGGSGAPQGDPAGGRAGRHRGDDVGRSAAPDEAPSPARALAVPPVPAFVPNGHAIADLGPHRCFRLLDRLGIEYDRTAQVVADARDAVEAPLLLRGPVGGVRFVHEGHEPVFEVADCRLVIALRRWAAILRAAGVDEVEHMSIYRPDARVRETGQPSGHSRGLAMDAARFHFEDGRVLDVLDDWKDKKLGEDPCDDRPDESQDEALLRSFVCQAAAQGIFEVIITPNHNRDHRNHVHVEVVPDVDWTYVH